MEHRLFKPKTFGEGQHAVVGDCNGIPMEERWKIETPLFAKAILKNLSGKFIIDYGCGVGRLSKEILSQNNDPSLLVFGVDDSGYMLDRAAEYVNDRRFMACKPQDLPDKQFDLIYCVYVLQHVPAIEIREILSRIHYYLKDDGVFIYCSSDYRMAIRFDSPGFFDDRFLGVNLREEISRFFTKRGALFDQETLLQSPVLKTMIEGNLPHPALDD